MVSTYRKEMTNFPFFLVLSYSTDIFTFILHWFYICSTYVLLVSLFVGFVLHPLSDSLLFTNLIISSSGQNSWYLQFILNLLLSSPRTSTWLCFLYLLHVRSFHTWLTSSACSLFFPPVSLCLLQISEIIILCWVRSGHNATTVRKLLSEIYILCH